MHKNSPKNIIKQFILKINVLMTFMILMLHTHIWGDKNAYTYLRKSSGSNYRKRKKLACGIFGISGISKNGFI